VQDINETNPLGTGGQIANAFAVLLKQLWLGKQSSVPPQRLKSLISEKVSQQFSGFAQHDAQELMAFLLDALHEDLNRIKQKPYIAVNSDECDNGNIADEQLADEAWKRYRMRNDSIVVDLFQGQFKSKLVCPVCGKVNL
jgi:ubiquitin C-terminal hydrolase